MKYPWSRPAEMDCSQWIKDFMSTLEGTTMTDTTPVNQLRLLDHPHESATLWACSCGQSGRFIHSTGVNSVTITETIQAHSGSHTDDGDATRTKHIVFIGVETGYFELPPPRPPALWRGYRHEEDGPR